MEAGILKSGLGLFKCLIASLLSLFLLPEGVVWADDLATGFDQANKLYAEGHYPEAISAYQKLLQTGKTSAALYYNLGNAYFKSGQIGRAIAYYRLTQNLNPRDPDLRANLQFARNRANAGFSAQTSRWRGFLQGMTLNEWTLVSMAFGWFWAALLTLRRWRDSLKSVLAGYTATIGIAWLVSLALLGLKIQAEFGHTPAVVVVREATVRYGPLEESRSFYTVLEGAEVEVVDRQDNWLQIRDASRRTGWLRRDQVIVVGSGGQTR